jgi:hypothetical protein
MAGSCAPHSGIEPVCRALVLVAARQKIAISAIFYLKQYQYGLLCQGLRLKAIVSRRRAGSVRE